MCRFIETIKIVNGLAFNFELHNERMNATRNDFFCECKKINLDDHVKCPDDLSGTVKCRVIYSKEVEEVDYAEYKPKIINKLKLVDADYIDYRYKYEDRSVLTALYDKKMDCDDVLIVKNGLVTDTSYSNIAFFDGKGWTTPRNPLLKGVKRHKLISEGILSEDDIRADDLKKFVKATLINAMLDPGEIELPIHNIIL